MLLVQTTVILTNTLLESFLVGSSAWIVCKLPDGAREKIAGTEAICPIYREEFATRGTLSDYEKDA